MRCVDLFAGAGGFSAGAEAAGLTVIAAANHWAAAVATYRLNHQGVAIFTQDLSQADFTQFPAHDVLLASPACQGHAKARGKDRPHHDASRSTAWAVVTCAEVHRPAFVVVENVPEFQQWALYPSWADALRRLGYELTTHILDASKLGVPQYRVRLFVVATRDKPAHRMSNLYDPLEIPYGVFEQVPAMRIINSECEAWSPIRKKGRAENTIRRIEQGRRMHGDTFILAYYGSERGGRSLYYPLGTITTRERFALVHRDRMRMLDVDEYRAGMGFPSGYKLPQNKKLAVHLLGNAVCPPVAEFVCSRLRRFVA